MNRNNDTQPRPTPAPSLVALSDHVRARQRPDQLNHVSLDSLTLDVELQPRAEIDRDLLADFTEALSVGHVLPAVIAFDDGTKWWLADGYHRWHAHKALGRETISCTVTKGSLEDALRYSLSANSKHGKRPTFGDVKRGYGIAVRHGLVEPTDVAGVSALLDCSVRWATALTQEARAEADAARNARIVELKAEGKSTREIGREVGVDHATVVRHKGGGAKGNSSELHHPAPDLLDRAPPTPVPKMPPSPPPARPEVFSEKSERWHAVLRAMREVNALGSIDELFAEPYRRFDHVLGPELDQARSWIESFHRRFHSPDHRRAASRLA